MYGGRGAVPRSLPGLRIRAEAGVRGKGVPAHQSEVSHCVRACGTTFIASSRNKLSPPSWTVSVFSHFQYQGVLLNDKGACVLVVYCGRLRNNECCDTLGGMCVLIRGTPYGRAGHVAGLHLRCHLPSLEGY